MNKYKFQILTDAKKIVTDIFRSKVNPLFVFHNLDHTEQVVNAAEEIGGNYELNNNDQLVLFVSAWFHDTGFSTGKAEEHEKESIKQVSDFLYHHNADQELILRIGSCIQATHMPQEPLNLVEKILCDADLYHLGTDMFSKWSDCLKQEFQNYFKRDFSEEKWRKHNIKFLKSHKYFTSYCCQKLEPVKQEWVKHLQNNQGTLA
ncbi:MAG: HD domain-containing protein [Ginsengibacter sp.]